MANTKHYSFNKKALSVILTVIMAFSYVGLLSGVFGLDWFGTKQLAYAATAGNYSIGLQLNVTNKADKQDNIQTAWVKISYKPNNGTGAEVTGDSRVYYDMKANWTSCGLNSKAWKWFYITVPGIPINVDMYLDAVWTDIVEYKLEDIKVYANGTEIHWNDCSMNMKSGGVGNSADSGNRDVGVPSSAMPYVVSGTWSGDDTAAIPLTANGTISKNYSFTGAVDQYGVVWGPDPSWSIADGDATVTAQGQPCTVKFNNNSGVDYTATVKASFASGNSDHNPAEFTKSVAVSARHTLTVKANGGNWSGSTTDKTYYGHTGDTQSIPEPTRTGYTFNGWTVSGGSISDATYTFANRNTSTLTAKWTLNNYTATFLYDNIPNKNGNVDPNAKKTVVTYHITDSGNVVFPNDSDLAKNYYTFNGYWKVEDTDGECSWSVGNTLYTPGNSLGANQYGDVTFRAQYTPIPYTLTFDPNGGSEVQQPDNANANTYDYNYESTEALPISTRLGYILKWKPSTTNGSWQQGEKYDPGTPLAGKHGSVHMVADWVSRTSMVYLTLGQNVTIPDDVTEYGYSFATGCTIPAKPVKVGYTFTGWKVVGVPSDAQYNAAVTVTVNGQPGLGNPPADNRWALDVVYPPESDGSTILPSDKFGDVTLTPVWTANTYTVRYTLNDGDLMNGAVKVSPASYSVPDSASDPYSVQYTIENTVTLPTPVRAGFDFNRWTFKTNDGNELNWSMQTDPSLSEYTAGTDLTNMYGSVTLQANWTPKTYTVTLKDGNTQLGTLNYSINADTSLASSVPSKTGYTFQKWMVTGSVEGTSWTLGDFYTNAVPKYHYGNLELTAQWTPTDYTITKTTNGGSNSASVTYHINDAAFTLGASELPGYTFQYWTVNANAGNWVKDTKYYADTSISGMWGNVGLTANFEPIGYTITYKDKDGATLYTDDYTIKDAVTIRDYAVDGYTFGGWEVSDFDESTGGGWHNGDDIPAGTLSANMYYGNVTLSPILTAKSYTVTYDFNGAPATCGNLPYTIESTDELPGNASANPPAKTGHDFSGWKVIEVGDEGNWTLNAVVEGNTALTGKYGSVTLQAQWTPKNYTITYITGRYPDGITKQGTYGQTAPDLTDAQKAKPADPQYTYTFDHWDPALTTVTGEATYTAVYTETLNKYDITWMIPDDVGGELANYTATVTPDVEYGAVPVYNNGVNPELASDNPDEYSWRFIGWATEIGGAKLESIPAVDGTATYYALFTKVLTPEEVNWVIEGVTNTELWGIGETPEWRHDTPTKPDANGYKYTFTHWDPTPVPVVDGTTYTYTAQFESSLQDYTITLKLNGGSMSDPLTMDYQKGESVTFPAPEKTGYTFAGWLLDAAVGTWEEGTLVSAEDLVNYSTAGLWGNVSFTAQWTPTQYTISFAQGSVYDELPDAFTYTIESTGTIPAATREGHSLDGWIVTVGDGNWTQGATLAAAYSLLNNYGDITLTPVWKTNTYSISWISGDYTETSEAEYGSAILVYQPRTKAGYTAAWNTAIPETMPAEDLTFTAVYTPVEYYVRLYVNGGNALDNFSYTIESNSTLPTPTRDGATFAGWKVTNPSGNWVLNAKMDGGASLNGKYGNVTLTAQWELETHTVTWIAGDVTKETVWFYGSVPSYDGTPYKAPDESNSYTFTGWDKEIVPVTEDVTYTALFEAIERKYTVIWNVDGTTTTEYYAYGDTPAYPGESDPVRLSTNEYDFTFSGWSPAVSEVTADVTYYAQFDVFTKLQGLSIDVSSLFMEIGANTTVNARLYPETATVRDVVWTSRNTEVATIDSTGTVTAVSPGVALINVSSVDKSFNAYCVVTVAPVHTSYLEIKAGGVSTTQLPGAMLQLTAILQPDNATDTGITWSSRDISVATVDNTGLVTFVSEGETDIVAVAADGFSRGSIHVVTTRNEEEVEDSVTTYRITFGEFATGFRFKEEGDVYTTGYCSVPEGETLRFKLDVENAKQANYSVLVNGSRISYGDDYWYALEDVHNNMVITLRSGDAGSNVPQIDIGGNNGNMSFFQRLAAFFRKIVEFFRGLFNR